MNNIQHTYPVTILDKCHRDVQTHLWKWSLRLSRRRVWMWLSCECRTYSLIDTERCFRRYYSLQHHCNLHHSWRLVKMQTGFNCLNTGSFGGVLWIRWTIRMQEFLVNSRIYQLPSNTLHQGVSQPARQGVSQSHIEEDGILHREAHFKMHKPEDSKNMTPEEFEETLQLEFLPNFHTVYLKCRYTIYRWIWIRSETFDKVHCYLPVTVISYALF